MDPGYNSENYQIIIDNAKLLGIDIKIFKSEIFDIVAGVNKVRVFIFAQGCAGDICTGLQRNFPAIR